MSKKRVLIVDDNKELLTMIGESFEAFDYEVKICENAGFAFSALKDGRFSAIITDVHMPYIDGVSFVRDLKAQGTTMSTPIFIVSGALEKNTLIRLKELGVAGFFIKPFDIAKLIDAVDKVIETKQKTAS
jgi:two-component system, chemotaxis family, chemotaxis protein CheY